MEKTFDEFKESKELLERRIASNVNDFCKAYGVKVYAILLHREDYDPDKPFVAEVKVDL